MGLVGDFSENEVFVYVRWLIQNFSRSVNSFELSRIFPDTLSDNGSDGESLSSVASLQLENLKIKGRNMQATLGQVPSVKIFIVSGLLRPDLSRIFR